MTLTPTEARRQEEKAQRRADILDAAEQVFAKKGVEKATMGDIAKAARLSRGLIYFYFEDKDDLDLAITERAIGGLYETFSAAACSVDCGCDKIFAIGKAYIRFFHDQPFYFDQLARFEAREVTTDAPPTALACQHKGRQVLQLMADALIAGIADGSVRPDIDDPMRTAVTLWGMTHGVLQVGAMKQGVLEEHGLTLESLTEHVLEMAGRALSP